MSSFCLCVSIGFGTVLFCCLFLVKGMMCGVGICVWFSGLGVSSIVVGVSLAG